MLMAVLIYNIEGQNIYPYLCGTSLFGGGDLWSWGLVLPVAKSVLLNLRFEPESFDQGVGLGDILAIDGASGVDGRALASRVQERLRK